MIVLNEDGKSYVEIKAWDDVVTRPGYKGSVNKDEIKLKTIIGKYRLSPKHPCGISSCRTAHNRGYLVVCENGIETNIGHECGKNIFGVDFKSLENKFNIETNALRFRENIKECQSKIDSYLIQASLLKESTLEDDGCYKKMKFFIERGFENKTLEALKQRARKKDNRILSYIELDSREREIAKVSGSSELYRTEQLAIINGISAVIDYKKMKKILETNLGAELDHFSQLNADALDYKDLKYWHNWVNRIDKRINQVKEIMEDCWRFLTDKNIATIRKYKNFL